MKKSFLSLSVEFAEMKLFFRQKICLDHWLENLSDNEKVPETYLL